ncbi:FHA domain-containing protein [Bacillus testis]|uniref:FHA domain-containing protein n=1 Tax=Bacillus testis TaxID=1622072 RepID=UPI00067ED90E|nr:FHA domain-containing protein [Bacillus testis]
MIEPFKLMLKSFYAEHRGKYTYIHDGQSILIGRASLHSKADFTIYNDFVSRAHCKLAFLEGVLYITDLESKHGTELNGVKLPPMQPIPFNEADQLTLVNGLIECQIERDDQVTRELNLDDLLREKDITLYDSMQTLYIAGQHIKMPAKEYLCFKLLYSRLNEVVPKEEIMRFAWEERLDTPYSFVSDEELTSLIYRVRKRIKSHFTIKAVPHKGYYLERIRK